MKINYHIGRIFFRYLARTLEMILKGQVLRLMILNKVPFFIITLCNKAYVSLFDLKTDNVITENLLEVGTLSQCI